MYDYRFDVFIKVADTGSFSKAGELLYTSPTAVIKKINALESSLGLTLFNRTHQGVTLTAAGKVIYEDIKYIIKYSGAALERARQATAEERIVIRIGQSLNTPCGALVNIWPRVKERYPEMKLQIVPFENNKKIVDLMFDNMGKDVDAYIGLFDPVMLEQRKCSALKLSDEPLRVAVPLTHRLASKDKIQISDLYGEHLVMVRQGKFKYYDELRCMIKSKHPNIIVEDCESVTIEVLNMCDDRGWPMVIIDPWSSIHPMFKTLPVNWKVTTCYGLVCAKNPEPRIRKFLLAIEDALKLPEENRFYPADDD